MVASGKLRPHPTVSPNLAEALLLPHKFLPSIFMNLQQPREYGGNTTGISMKCSSNHALVAKLTPSSCQRPGLPPHGKRPRQLGFEGLNGSSAPPCSTTPCLASRNKSKDGAVSEISFNSFDYVSNPFLSLVRSGLRAP